ncbi:MAG: NAD(P)/FAD-dependent oxidoreductase [Bacillota bacterium]
MKILIIGNSAAGLSAAGAIRKISPTAGITVISDEPGAAYSRCLIPEVISGSRDVTAIGCVAPQFYKELGINLISGKKAIFIKTGSNELFLEDGQSIGYDRLLIAAGSSPALPGWPGSDLPGVFTLRKAVQAAAIGEMARQCSSAVVEGGGLVSLKAACALKKRGVRDVTVLVKSPHLLIRQLDGESAGLVEKSLAGLGIKFYFGTGIASAEKGPRGAVQSVELEEGGRIPAEIVVVGKGVRPNLELVKSAGGATGAGISVDEYLQTSLPGIYAAGDCIEVTDFISGRKAVSGLWPLAVEQGRAAGCNMAGRPRKYPPPITRMNSAQFGPTPFISVGDIQGGDDRAVYREPGVYRKFCFTGGRLTGFIMVGRVDRAGLYTALIKKSERIAGSLKDRLIDGNLSGADIIPIK